MSLLDQVLLAVKRLSPTAVLEMGSLGYRIVVPDKGLVGPWQSLKEIAAALNN